MCYSVDEVAELWKVTTPKARKEHRCALCFLPILPGVIYDKIVCISQGTASTDKTHSDCHALTRFLQLDVCGQNAYAIMPGDLRNEVAEHMDEDIEVRRMYRRVLRARIAEGVWPVRGAP